MDMIIFSDGFESSNGWSTSLDSYDTTRFKSGAVSGKIVKTTAGEKVVHSNIWTPINNSEATEYIFSGWIYSDNPSADLFFFEKKEGETGYFTKVEYIRTTTKNQWVYVEKKVIVAANIRTINIRLCNNGGGTVWFDDVSIRKVNDPLAVEIREEKHFYPFGLEHKGYNNTITGTKNNYKQFQGQEFTEDLGLSIHEWKYRVSDPSIGRFWQIDPLAEDYVYNGTYNFAENRVIDSAELEGLERIYAADGKFINQVGDSDEIRVMKNNTSNAQDLVNTANNTKLSSEERAQAVNTLNSNSLHGYANPDEAAISFSKSNHVKSQDADAEIGVAIKEMTLYTKDGEEFLGQNRVSLLGDVVTGEDRSQVNAADLIEASSNVPGVLAGLAHTHPNGDSTSRWFSTGGGGLFSSDKVQSKRNNVPVYISTDWGEVRRGDFHLKNYNEGKKGKRINSNVPGRTHSQRGW